MTRLEEIAKRAEAATPGKWKPNSNEGYCDRWMFIDQGDGIYIRDADAEFIAHAREDVPYLLALVASLSAEVASEYARHMP
jgi:hypothetical protein